MAQANLSASQMFNLPAKASRPRKEFEIRWNDGTQTRRILALEMSIEGEIVKLSDADPDGFWTLAFAAHLRAVSVRVIRTNVPREEKEQ